MATATAASARARTRRSTWILRGYGAIVLAFLYLPILVIVAFSFSSNRIPTLPINSLTLDWYREAASDTTVWHSLRTSFVIATVVGLVSCLVGLLAAKELAWHRFRGKGLILLLVLVPMVVPLLAFGLASFLLFRAIGIEEGTLAVTLAHMVFGISFATLILYARLLEFRRSLMEAAASLGASPTRAFFEVLVPLVAPGLIAAFLLPEAPRDDLLALAAFAGVKVTWPEGAGYGGFSILD